ncbi:hypothetical protein [Legionella tunisiensis]|uniref:hypothetical protein n=1 Tax=Legionella tunisiensis TaxID=1034944 RepID=UPI00037D7107|nr:hypothetical protein [Legionella tunisiensis]
MAKDLAAELKMPYLLLLIPTLKNLVDPDKLSRLEQAPDTRAIFLSDDGVWHRILGLLEHLQHGKGQLATYDMAKQFKPRALTLSELYRIRCKRGDDLAFQLKNENYASFWDYVLRVMGPTWQRRGDWPTHLLPNLLEIIENYHEAVESGKKDFTKFQRNIKTFAIALSGCPLEDINHLYGTSIDLEDENRCYLIEILLDCMHNTDDLGDKLTAVAKWLCKFDPTLVGKHEKLQPLYQSLKVGKYFEVAQLRELIQGLDLDDHDPLKPEISKLLKQLDEVDEIKPELIEQIKGIYELRWKSIIDTPNDYTRRQDKPNRSWICLARHLASAGHIHPNYYKLLIPTLKLDHDPVTQELFTIYPLSHMILSDNGTKLILAQHLVDHHKANGTFYQCSENPPCPLTQLELSRLRFAVPRYYDYFCRIVETEPDPGISVKTVEAIRELVNGTLNPVGLLLGYDISQTQLDVADKAYIKFLEYIAGLEQAELDRLYKQRITHRARQFSFATIMQKTQHKYDDDDRGCIAVYGQYLLRLVLDYNPQAEFRREIEKDDKIEIDSLRRVSARKVYREYDEISEQEATRRSLIILVSLMTHGFSYLPFTSTSLQMWDKSNNVPDSNCIELFNALSSFTEKRDVKQSRFIYAFVMENIVKRATATNGFLSSLTRYNDTLQWWKSIEDQSIFAKENNTCFEPEQLFTVIWSLLSKRQFKSRMLIENFLEKIVQTSLQPKNPQLQWARINIEFNKLLNNIALPAEDRANMLEKLRKGSTPIGSDQYLKANREFLTHRLASCGAREGCKRKIGLFGANPGAFKLFYSELTEMLKEDIFGVDIKSLVSTLQKKLKN